MQVLFNNSQIVDYIKANKDISYVAIVTTPWHLIGFEYCLKYNIQENEKGIILIAEHKISGLCLDIEKIKTRFNKNVHYFQYKNLNKVESTTFLDILKVLSCNKSAKTIKIISPERPWVRLAILLTKKEKFNFEFIIFDEGLGEYYRKSLYYYNGLNKIYYFVKNQIEAVMVKRYKTIDNSLFLLKNHKLIKQENIINIYRKKFELKLINKNEKKINRYVIINTQTYHDNGELLSDADVDLIKKLVTILHKCNYTVLLKPHPRDMSIERYKQLGVNIIDKTRSQEEFIASQPTIPSYVLGFTTTTLITLSLFFDIKTISLVDCIDKKYLCGNAIKDFRMFRKIFYSMVYIPQSLDELEGRLSNE